MIISLPDMIDQKHGGEEEGGNMDGPEKYGNLDWLDIRILFIRMSIQSTWQSVLRSQPIYYRLKLRLLLQLQ